jgi:16S rRNA (guanine(966)-N(2))-methyltransferase RsmD
MAVRVISGRAHGRRLRVPAGGVTRPTSGLVRGALFDMLAHRGWLTDARVLELFAGSGALGIEALSRGARTAVFVESAPAAIRALRTNLALSGCADRAEVLPVSLARGLRALARQGRVFDGVLADPPYGAGWPRRTLDAVVAAGVLAPGGWMAIEHRVDEAAEPAAGLTVVRRRRHGNTMLTVLAADRSPS